MKKSVAIAIRHQSSDRDFQESTHSLLELKGCLSAARHS